MMLGKAVLTSKNRMDTWWSVGCAHVSWMNFVIKWSESVVAHPGRPLKWVEGSRLCLFAIQDRSSVTQVERILDMVSSRAIGW